MDNRPPLEIGPEHPDFQSVYLAKKAARYAKLVAVHPLLLRLGGLGMVLLGAGAVWFNWHILTTEHYFYIYPVIGGPAFVVLGVPLMFLGRDSRVVANVGTPKRGLKVLGVIGSVLWLGSVIFLAYRFETYQPSDPDYLSSVAKGMNRGLPRMDSAELRLDSVTAGPGKKLTITYTLLDRDSGAPLDPSVPAAMLSDMKESDCKEPAIQHVLDRGAPIDYRFLGRDGRPIVQVRLTQAACK